MISVLRAPDGPGCLMDFCETLQKIVAKTLYGVTEGRKEKGGQTPRQSPKIANESHEVRRNPFGSLGRKTLKRWRGKRKKPQVRELGFTAHSVAVDWLPAAAVPGGYLT